jgi:hypothetical protein
MSARQLRSWLLVTGAFACTSPAWAADGCLDFKWDVTRERAVFAHSAIVLAAATNAAGAPAVSLEQLYKLNVSAAEGVQFAAAPGKTPPAGSRGGIVKFKVPAAGSYRVSLDVGAWIDVVASGALVPTQDFQGQHSCDAPHKIVVFELAAQQWYLLQLSGASAEAVRLSITAAPSRLK